MTTMTIVLDASVALSWVLDEEDGLGAGNVLSDIASGKVLAIAPTIWLYETINALKMAIVRSRITQKQAAAKISDILEINPEFVDFGLLLSESFEIAIKYELSMYDASYVSLAKLKGCDFYTGDTKLFKKVKGKLKFVKLASEYGVDKTN